MLRYPVTRVTDFYEVLSIARAWAYLREVASLASLASPEPRHSRHGVTALVVFYDGAPSQSGGVRNGFPNTRNRPGRLAMTSVATSVLAAIVQANGPHKARRSEQSRAGYTGGSSAFQGAAWRRFGPAQLVARSGPLPFAGATFNGDGR